jgi:hypothetical protein
MKIQYVPLEYVSQTWPLVEQYISSALEHGHGEYTTEQVKVYLVTGQWTLYVAVDDAGALHGAGTVCFNNMPNDRVAFVTTIGGRLFTSQDTWQQFVDLLKARGATQVEGAARESIARLWKRYGFEEKYRIVSVRI